MSIRLKLFQNKKNKQVSLVLPKGKFSFNKHKTPEFLVLKGKPEIVYRKDKDKGSIR